LPQGSAIARGITGAINRLTDGAISVNPIFARSYTDAELQTHYDGVCAGQNIFGTTTYFLFICLLITIIGMRFCQSKNRRLKNTLPNI
jgi:hypothetical protein